MPSAMERYISKLQNVNDCCRVHVVKVLCRLLHFSGTWSCIWCMPMTFCSASCHRRSKKRIRQRDFHRCHLVQGDWHTNTHCSNLSRYKACWKYKSKQSCRVHLSPSFCWSTSAFLVVVCTTHIADWSVGNAMANALSCLNAITTFRYTN